MNDSLPETIPPYAAHMHPRTLALATRENEGGVGLAALNSNETIPGNTEAEQMRVRGIALENLVIALLADATDQQRELARDMGGFISSRPSYTPHPITLRAAEAMGSLLERADRFRSDPLPEIRV